MKPPAKLQKLLRSTREAQSLTLLQLGRRIGVSSSYLSRIETGDKTHQPSEALLVRLAAELGLDEDALLVAAGRIPKDVHAFLIESPSTLEKVRKMMGRAA